MLKWILKIAVFIMGAFLTLFVAALIFFSSSTGENIIKNILVKRISEQLGLTVAIGRFETNLFSRVQADTTAIISPASPGPDSLLVIGKIKVTYSIFDLLSGDMKLEAVVIDKVNLNISVDSLGNYGIPMLDAAGKDVSEEQKTSMYISIDAVTLTEINASYADERVPIDIIIYNLSSHISGRGENNYDGRLSADSILTYYEGEPIYAKDLSCDFSWDGSTLSATPAAVIEGLSLNASASLKLPELDELSMKASLEGDPTRLLKILRNKYELPEVGLDNIAVTADAAGSIDSLEAGFSILSRRSRVEGIDLDSFRLKGRYSSKQVFIDTAIVETLGGSVLARGSVSLEETAALDLNLLIKNMGMVELWPAVYKNKSPFAGKVNGYIRAKGKIDTISGWDVNGSLDLSSLKYQDRPISDLQLKFSVLNDSARLELIHSEDTIKTVAVLKNGQIAGHFYAAIPRISSISRFADMPELKGNITAEGAFGGTIDNPLITARLKGSGISYMNFPVDDLVADIQYVDSNMIINALQLSGRRPDSGMYQSILGIDSLYGQFEYICDIRGSMDSLEGDISAKVFSLEYSGYAVDSAFAYATIRGSRIELNNLDIYYKDLIFATFGSYDTVYANGVFKTDIFSGSVPGGEIENENSGGNIEKIKRGVVVTEFGLLNDGNLSLEIDCDSVWVGLLKNFVGNDAPDDGCLFLNLAFRGNAADPAGSLTAAVYSIKYPSYGIDSVMVAADLYGEHLRLSDFQLHAYGNSISANTDIYFDRGPDKNLILSEESAMAGAMTIDSLDLSILKPYLAPTGEIKGISSAVFTWDGTLKDPGLKGWVDVSDGYLKYMGDSMPLDQIHLRLNLSDSIFSIDSASCYSSGTPLSVKGAVRYDFSGNYEISSDLSIYNVVLLSAAGKITKDDLDLRIFSDNFNLDILRPFITMADSLGGSLKSEVSVAGKTNMPDITGYINITDFSFFSSELSAIIKSGFLRTRFDKNRIDIDSLYADINGGPVSLSGYLVHDAGMLADINLNLKASNISYKKAGIFEGELQFADLKYGRKEDQYFLEGDVSLGESRLIAKFPLNSILPWAQSVETVEYEFPDIISRTRLNVRFRENDDLWIDNNLANIRMKAELGIIGTPVRPNLSGPVNIEEGYLIYLDRRFKVEKGNLYFSDPLRLNPEIMLLAKTQVTKYQRTVAEKYTVYIKIEGNLDNLRLDIYSEPPLDKPDIIALLTLGTTRSRLAGGSEDQGGIRNVLVERASRLTSDRVSGYISDKVGSMFGFDEFTVEGNLFQFDNSWGPRLVASRRISKRVELTYSTTVGHLNDQGVRLGYQLTPRISIQGETDQAGRSGIDFRYGLKFR